MTPAQEVASSAESRLDLATLVQEAQANNPEIRAAGQRLEAAKAMVPQARTLPDPMINLGYEELHEREAMYGLSQEIPFPGKLRLRGEVAARAAEQMAADYEAMRLKVIAELKETYFNLHLAHKATEILQRNRQLLVGLADTTQSRYAVGEGAQADVFRAQAEVSRILARLAELRQQQQSQGAMLNKLLNRPAADPVGVPEDIRALSPARSLAELTALAGTSAPRLQAQSKAVEQGDAAIALAKREYLPDFEIEAQGLRDPPAGEDGYRVMLNVTVPLFYASKQRYGVREALAGREAASGDLQGLRQELAAQVADNVAQLERARQLIGLLENAIIPQARATLDSARASYTVGKVDFLTLLSSLLALQDSELELHEQIVEHEKARARLEEIIGEAP
jgi:outer membrane protein TolC